MLKNIHIDQKLEQKGPSPPHLCLTFSQHDQTRFQRALRVLPDGYSTVQASYKLIDKQN